MGNITNNVKKGWKSTLIGLFTIISSVAYLFLKDDVNLIILFGLLGVGVSLLFTPDSLIKGIESLIDKNKERQF